MTAKTTNKAVPARRRLRTALLCIWLVLSLVILLYLLVPLLLPKILGSAISRGGGRVQSCPLRFATIGRMVGDRCEIVTGSGVSVLAENVEMFVTNPFGFPELRVGTLAVKFAPDAKSSAAVPFLEIPPIPFRRIVVERGRVESPSGSTEFRLVLERNFKVLQYQLDLSKVAVGSTFATDSANFHGTIQEAGGALSMSIVPVNGSGFRVGVGACELQTYASAVEKGLAVRIGTNAVSGESGAMTISRPELQCGDVVIRASAMKATASSLAEDGTLGMGIVLETPELVRGSWRMPLSVGEIKLVLRESQLIVSLPGVAGGIGAPVVLNAQHSFVTKSGAVSGALGPAVLPADQPLTLEVGKENMPVAIAGGSISIRPELAWEGGALTPSSTVAIDASAMSGRFGDVTFQDVRGTGKLSIAPELKTTEPLQLQAGSISAGIEFKNFVSKVTLKKGPGVTSYILIEDAKSEVFGGRVFVARAEADNGELKPLDVALSNIDLSQVVAVVGESVSGTGTLQGLIPVEMTPDGIVVREGKVTALPPGGELRYLPSAEATASAEGNPGMSLALRALNQFQYEKLDSVLRYDADGTLTANVSLLGRNPELFKGRQIQFNVNVEQNIPSLLKSLRLATRAEDEIWKQP